MDAPELKYLAEIERYLDGEMTEGERVHFEQELATNKQLSAEYNLLHTIVERIKTDRKQTLKALLKEADKELDKEKQGAKIIPLHYLKYAVAASVLLMLSLGVVWFYYNNTTNTQNLMAAYWQKDVGLPVMMDEQANAAFDNAMSLYKNNDYHSALTAFSSLPLNDTVQYFKALCSHELKQDDFVAMQEVANNKKSVFSPKANYYLLLYYVQHNEKQNAKKLLNDLLAMPQHPYRDRIIQLSREAYFKE